MEWCLPALRHLAVAALVLTSTALGCGGRAVLAAEAWSYFEAPAPDDPWSRKIHGWQVRESALPGPGGDGDAGSGVAAGSQPDAGARAGVLRAKYDAFRVENRRALARALATWIQEQSQVHYVSDGPRDHWATLEETLASGGDDCDGLELLAYRFLRDMGFGDDRVFRAIVRRRDDGQHHMVTLWFEGDDPWVIDPTGAMTSGMPHMSEVPGWVPVKLFSETEEYTVRTGLSAPPRTR